MCKLIFFCIVFYLTILSCQRLPLLNAQESRSVIETIQNLLPSLVVIKSENAGLYRGPDQYVRDGRKLYVINPVRVAQYARRGGGVIIDSSGVIVTNAHTVDNAGRIKVILNDNTELEAKVIFLSVEDDLAFLRISPKSGLSAIPFAGAESMKLGAPVFSVGSSEILKGSISNGKIIGVGTKNSNEGAGEASIEMLKINFDIYHGDSGAPVISEDGKLIGLLMAGSTNTAHLIIAIPSQKIKKYYIKCLENEYSR